MTKCEWEIIHAFYDVKSEILKRADVMNDLRDIARSEGNTDQEMFISGKLMEELAIINIINDQIDKLRGVKDVQKD